MDVIERSKTYVLSLFRMVVGLLFTFHGMATLFDVFGGPRSGQVPEVGQWPSWWAAAIQLVGGALVLIGLFTRVAALVCSGSMAYAYFVVHQGQGLTPLENGGELSALFCWAFLLFVFLGPGKWAVDEVLAKARTRTRTTEPSLA